MQSTMLVSLSDKPLVPLMEVFFDAEEKGISLVPMLEQVISGRLRFLACSINKYQISRLASTCRIRVIIRTILH